MCCCYLSNYLELVYSTTYMQVRVSSHNLSRKKMLTQLQEVAN